MNSCLLSDGEKENGFCLNSLLFICLIRSYQNVTYITCIIRKKGNILQLPGCLIWKGFKDSVNCIHPVSLWVRLHQAQINHNLIE